jgi:hypothetical protein
MNFLRELFTQFAICFGIDLSSIASNFRDADLNEAAGAADAPRAILRAS